MPLKLQTPATYLITSGQTTLRTEQTSSEFVQLLRLVRAAVAAQIDLVQLREKSLRPRLLYELTLRAAETTRGSHTRLLVNDRACIAQAAGADGVHLTTASLDAAIVRQTFGSNFVIGVSAHSLMEARAARDGASDFATFSPIFEMSSKRQYGAPLGLAQLREAVAALKPFPLIALGGITLDNARDALRAGASGIAGISLFSSDKNLEQHLKEIARAIRTW